MSKKYIGYKGSGYNPKKTAIHLNKTLTNFVCKAMMAKYNINCKYYE